MKKLQQSQVLYISLGIVLLCVGSLMVKGCEREQNKHQTSSPQGEAKDIQLFLPESPSPQAKALTYYIYAMGLDDEGNEIGPEAGPVTIPNPTFPLTAAITLYVPPCSYRITIGVTLVRDAAREKSGVYDVCENSTLDFSILTFEAFEIYDADPIDAPDSAVGGDAVDVWCGTRNYSAPDEDRYPLSIQLWEDGGGAVSDTLLPNMGVSGTFDDPFAQDSEATQRIFYCTFSDSRSPDQTFQKIITRLPDVDGDGIPDADDNCPLIANESQADKDGDGVGNVCDNCPETDNSNQRDSDGDEVGDSCDNCPETGNSNQRDSDGDEVGDSCDNCPDDANPDQEDSDSNGIGDACDDPCGSCNYSGNIGAGPYEILWGRWDCTDGLVEESTGGTPSGCEVVIMNDDPNCDVYLFADNEDDGVFSPGEFFNTSRDLAGDCPLGVEASAP